MTQIMKLKEIQVRNLIWESQYCKTQLKNGQ